MDELVLGRVGHYFVPGGPDEGSCEAAVIAFVHPQIAGVTPTVNLTGLHHDGETFRRLDVPVIAGNQGASFHLTRACAWSR